MKNSLDKILLYTFVQRRWVLLFLGIYILACAYGITQLTIDKRVNVMSQKQLKEEIINIQKTDRVMYDNTSIVFFAGKDLFSPPIISALYQLQLTLESSPLVKRVDSLFDITNFNYENGVINIRPVFYRIPQTPEQIQSAKEEALSNPFFRKNFISDDGNVMAMYVTGSGQTMNGKPDLYGAEIDKLLNTQLATLKKEFSLTAAFHIGAPKINETITKLITRDMFTTTPMALAILIVIIMLLFRTRWSVFIPLFSAILIIYLTFGTMGLIGLPINVLTSALPTLIIAVSCAASIHIFSAYLHGIADGLDRQAAVIFTLKRIGFPVFIAEITTLIGFGATAITRVIMIQDFGYSAMLGIFITALIMLLILPIILYYFGPKKTKLSFNRIKSDQRSWIHAAALFLSYITEHHKKYTIIISIILSLASVYFATKIQINSDLRSYFSPKTELIKHTNMVNRYFPGVENFNIDLITNKQGAFADPNYLHIITDIENYVKNSSDFSSTISIADQLSIINQAMHDNNPSYYRIPNNKNLIEQYYLFFSREALQPFVSSDLSQAYIIVRHSIANSSLLNDQVKKFTEYAKAKNWPGVQVNVTGAFLKEQQMAVSLVKNQLLGIPLAFLGILAVMVVAFTSFKTGLLSLIPNVFPVLVAFGAMGLLHIPLNPGTIIVAFIAVGIGIDDTAHLFSIFKYHYQHMQNTNQAIRETLTHELLPVVTTSVALAAGFFILSFSSFEMIADFGIVSAIAIISALLADLTMTPALLGKIRQA